MKILILSDLHLEFATFEPPKTDANVVILAGDTQEVLNGRSNISQKSLCCTCSATMSITPKHTQSYSPT